MRCNDKPQTYALDVITSFDQIGDIDGKLNEMILVQRANRVIDEDVFEIVEVVRLALIDFGDVARADDLI